MNNINEKNSEIENKNILKNKELMGNINKDYIFTLLRSFDLTSGIWMLYLAYRGLNLFEIGLMESLYHISSFSMEIPTGIVADVYGRKTSRILGRTAQILSTLMMIFGGTIIHFGISFFLQALGNNLESGAGEALIYDSMKENGEESGFMKVKGRQEMFFQIARGMSLVVGGYLGTLDYSLVYKGAMVIAVVTLIQSITFVEPSIGKIKREESMLKTFKKQLLTSINVIRADYRIAFLIVSVEIISTFVTTEYFYVQNYLKSIGRNELEIGIILALGAVAAIVSATYTHKIEKTLKFRGIFTLIPILGILCFFGITVDGLTEISIIVTMAMEGILFVSTSDYINKLIPSEQRATILSFQSMAFSFFMILLFPVVGKIGDVFGLIIAFKAIGIIATIVLLMMMAFVWSKKNRNWEEKL